MRVPNEVHEAAGWLIERIAPDFRLLDVWALPVEGSAEEFADFLELGGSFDPASAGSVASRILFAVRLRLGQWLGWDDATNQLPIPGCDETSLRDRLPEDLRARPDDPLVGAAMRQAAGGFVPVYRTESEAAAEISNSTVHGVLHLSWVEQAPGRYRAHLAVYVKARGRGGELYLWLIDPFRHLVVYPALLRQIGRRWASRRADTA